MNYLSAIIIVLKLVGGYAVGSGSIVQTSAFDPFSVETIALFGGAVYCTQIFKEESYNCGSPCSGIANNTALVSTIESSLYVAGGLITKSKPLNAIFVAFRGTETNEELQRFLRLRLTGPSWTLLQWIQQAGRTSSKMKVHAGYEQIYISIRNRTQHMLKKAVDDAPGAQLVFIGHSLGGALATMAAIDYEVHSLVKSPISLYTFGTPRLGNRAWARFVDQLSFHARNYRIVRRGDIVAELPTQVIGYEHSGQPYYFDVNGSTLLEKCPVEPGTSESPSCMKSAFPSISLHYRMNSYFGMGLGC